MKDFLQIGVGGSFVCKLRNFSQIKPTEKRLVLLDGRWNSASIGTKNAKPVRRVLALGYQGLTDLRGEHTCRYRHAHRNIANQFALRGGKSNETYFIQRETIVCMVYPVERWNDL